MNKGKVSGEESSEDKKGDGGSADSRNRHHSVSAKGDERLL
jgi:hypothetical protein